MRVLTIGTFDLLHIGHLELFNYCKRFGDLVIGLNTDEFVLQYKGKLPVQNYVTRWDNIVRFVGIEARKNEEAGKELIEWVDPDVIVVGMDWHEEDYLNQIGIDVEYLNDNDIILAYAPRTTGVSTTALKEKL